MAEGPGPPSSSEPGEPRCPRCGAPHEPDQEYCLECGLRLPGPAPLGGPGGVFRREVWTRESPAWLWAALVALLLVALIAGAIVAVAASGNKQKGAQTPTTVVGSGGVSTETVPIFTGAGTITVGTTPPTITVQPPTTSIQTGTGAATTTAPATTSPTVPSGPIGEWPQGTQGFTIILASVPHSQGRAAADEVAQRAATLGLPQTGLLDSSQFSSLRPGYYVAFSGVYSTLAEAQAALAQARSAGFPLAYVRQIRA